jgi:hypothetical protein
MGSCCSRNEDKNEEDKEEEVRIEIVGQSDSQEVAPAPPNVSDCGLHVACI